MITRMEITYKSENPYNDKPEIFTTGGYTINQNGNDIHFDFEDMAADACIKDNYLYIYSEKRNIDETVSKGINPEELGNILLSVKKEDFTEIYYECYADREEQNFIKLIPENIAFYAFDEFGNMTQIEITGDEFININE